MQKRKPMMIDKKKFKFFGLVSCVKCANNWKISLKQKGKHVRLIPIENGVEIWAT